MKLENFSTEFDTFLNSYNTQVALSPIDMGFTEYEKSVFLTAAQEDIVKELYAGTYTTEAFESSEFQRRALESLVVQDTPTIDNSEGSPKLKDKFVHTIYTLPEECMYLVYEQATLDSSEDSCLADKTVDILPIVHDEYGRIRNNPFRGPNNRRILRLDQGNRKVELVSSVPIKNYIIRYIKYPYPIILVNLDGTDVTINGETTSRECELPDFLHNDIIQRAVRLALASKTLTKSNGDSK